MMQLLIYVGAICITYIFAIMLSPPMEQELPKRKMAKVIYGPDRQRGDLCRHGPNDYQTLNGGRVRPSPGIGASRPWGSNC